ncbi:MAG: hypothetical protein N3E38_03030 [Candidatus Aenigmarchaeota archaeon]|nr:hypothetical protein [Candidatus Aenigmarchaeota archaeon]
MQQLSIIKSFSEFVSIKNRWLPCKNPSTLLEKISCFITGYMPTKTTSLLEVIIIIYGFYLYAFVIPIIVCMHLMKNFIDASGVIQNETYKNIIAFGFALLIYRFLIVAKIIDFLYIGYLGVGIIIVNLLAINYVIKKTRKMFLKIKDISEKKQKGRKIEDLKRFAKASLSRLKYIPSVNLMSVIFEDRIRNNLKTIFEAEGRLNEFEDLVAEFEDAVNRKDKNGMLLAIDKMIAAIS